MLQPTIPVTKTFFLPHNLKITSSHLKNDMGIDLDEGIKKNLEKVQLFPSSYSRQEKALEIKAYLTQINKNQYSDHQKRQLLFLWEKLSTITLNTCELPTLHDAIQSVVCFPAHYNQLESVCISSFLDNKSETDAEKWVNTAIIERYRFFEESILTKINSHIFKNLHDPQNSHQINPIRFYLDKYYHVYGNLYQDDRFNSYLNPTKTEKEYVKNCITSAISKVVKDTEEFDFSLNGWIDYLYKKSTTTTACPDFSSYLACYPDSDFGKEFETQIGISNTPFNELNQTSGPSYFRLEEVQATHICVTKLLPQKPLLKHMLQDKITPHIQLENDSIFNSLFDNAKPDLRTHYVPETGYFLRNSILSPKFILAANGSKDTQLDMLETLTNQDKLADLQPLLTDIVSFLHIILANSPEPEIVRKVLDTNILSLDSNQVGLSLATTSLESIITLLSSEAATYEDIDKIFSLENESLDIFYRQSIGVITAKRNPIFFKMLLERQQLTPDQLFSIFSQQDSYSNTPFIALAENKENESLIKDILLGSRFSIRKKRRLLSQETVRKKRCLRAAHILAENKSDSLKSFFFSKDLDIQNKIKVLLIKSDKTPTLGVVLAQSNPEFYQSLLDSNEMKTEEKMDILFSQNRNDYGLAEALAENKHDSLSTFLLNTLLPQERMAAFSIKNCRQVPFGTKLAESNPRIIIDLLLNDSIQDDEKLRLLNFVGPGTCVQSPYGNKNNVNEKVLRTTILGTMSLSELLSFEKNSPDVFKHLFLSANLNILTKQYDGEPLAHILIKEGKTPLSELLESKSYVFQHDTLLSRNSMNKTVLHILLQSREETEIKRLLSNMIKSLKNEEAYSFSDQTIKICFEKKERHKALGLRPYSFFRCNPFSPQPKGPTWITFNLEKVLIAVPFNSITNWKSAETLLKNLFKQFYDSSLNLNQAWSN